jgi:hypothetical protein
MHNLYVVSRGLVRPLSRPELPSSSALAVPLLLLPSLLSLPPPLLRSPSFANLVSYGGRTHGRGRCSMVGVSSAAACRGVSPSLDPHSHPHFTHTLSYTLTYSPPCLTYLPPSTGARPSPIQLRMICTDIETIWCGAGDDVILSDPHYFLPFHARAMTYVDVMVLAADTLMQVSGRLTEQFTLT